MMTQPDGTATGRGRRFILVTGMPRSGTTAVGSVLSSGPRASYFYEPFNPISGLYSITDWFVFPDGTGARVPVDRLVQQVLKVDLRLRAGLWDADPWHRRLLKRFSGSRTRFSGLRCRVDPRLRTIVWKDPAAAFLTPELASTYGFPTVVTVRSPEASAASFKRLDWGFDVARLSRQLQQITPGAAYLEADFADTARNADPVVNAALLWRLLYGYLDTVLPTAGPGAVAWANGRRIVSDPENAYRDLFHSVGLTLVDANLEHIREEYQDRGRTQPDARKAHDRQRNVTQVNDYWRDTLTDEERALVAGLTDDVRRQLESRRTGPL